MNSLLPRAVIFDWDNTLVDSWAAIADAINETLKHFGMPVWSIDEVKNNCTRSARESFPDWFGDRWEEATEVFYARFKKVQMQNLSPMKSAGDLLAFLSKQGIPCMIVSNKNGSYLREEVQALGWNSYFSAIVGATDAPRDKPAREHADHALKLAGIESGNDVWFIGDSELDIVCARNADCTPVLLGHKDSAMKWDVDRYFTDCADLLALLCRNQRAIA
jgi:phosphoglycolate phosphatase